MLGLVALGLVISATPVAARDSRAPAVMESQQVDRHQDAKKKNAEQKAQKNSAAAKPPESDVLAIGPKTTQELVQDALTRR